MIRTESSGGWQNRDCGIALPYVCKKKPNATTDPFLTGELGLSNLRVWVRVGSQLWSQLAAHGGDRGIQGGHRFGKLQSSTTSVLSTLTGWTSGEMGDPWCFPRSLCFAVALMVCKQKGFYFVPGALKLPLLAPCHCKALPVAVPCLGLLSQAQSTL